MKGAFVLAAFLYFAVNPLPLYGGVQEVCNLEKVAQGIDVVTPDVKEYLIRVFKGPCVMLREGDREAAMRQLKALIPLIESYVGREITREEADRVIQEINRAMMGL